MRKHFAFYTMLAVLLVAGIAGCSKNENPTGVTTGKINGKITDAATGSFLKDAIISTTPTTKSVVSDSAGSYEIASVAAGTYTINVTKPGYNNGSLTVTVTAGQTVTVVIPLTVGSGGDSLLAPANPTPADGAGGQPTNLILRWSPSGPDKDSLLYDVYFDTNPAPQLAGGDLKETSFARNGLEPNKTYYWRVVVRNKTGNQKSSPVWSFITTSSVNNNPPTAPMNPNPANGAASQPYSLTLRWTASDPDGDPLKYDVLFGTNSTPSDVVATDLSNPNFAVNKLTQGTTYYWRVIAKDNHNGTTPGPIWSFSVKTNLPPNAPNTPTPPNGATDLPLSLTLRWNATDDDGDALKYDLYLGTNGAASDLIATDLSNPNFVKDGLDRGTTYSWKVVAKDGNGGETSGPVWSFTTGTPPAPKLVAFYPFNGNANDESGNGHDGTVHGAVQVSDRTGTGTAYLFNNTNYISVSSSGELAFGSRSFTLNAWIKLSGTQQAYAGIIASGPAGTHFPGYQLTILNGNKIAAQVGKSNGEYIEPIGSRSLDDDKWHFVSLVVDPVAGTAKLYVDTILDAQGSSSSLDVSLSYTSPLLIGTERNASVYFQGGIDDVRIYNGALSLGEIQALFK